MKKIIAAVCVIGLLISVCGCSGFFGGMHSRNLGEFVNYVTVDGKDYLAYSISLRSGYVEIGDNSYQLADVSNAVDKVSESMSVFSAYSTALSHGDHYEEGYAYIAEMISGLLGENALYYETVFLKTGDNVYGAINQYSRSSGRSGNLLSYEDLEKSYLVQVLGNDFEILAELDDIAIIAFSQTGYIAYKDKSFFTVNIGSGQETEICKDIWWDEGPTFYSYVNVYFIDDVFMICGNEGTSNADYITLIVGNISDGSFETLIDNEKIEY